MPDLTEEPDELPGQGTIPDQVSDQNREIKKWRAIARMVNNNPDVLTFSLSTTEPERRWAFFALASGVLAQSIARGMNEPGDISEVSVAIF